MKRFRLLVLSSFNADAFRGYVENLGEVPSIQAFDAGFGQAAAVLAQGTPPEPADGVVIWTRPEDVSPAFRRLLEGDLDGAGGSPEADAESFARSVTRFAAQGPYTLVASWAIPRSIRSHGAVVSALAAMNGALARSVAKSPRVRLLDSQRWIAASGARAWSAKSWHLSKNPFGAEVHREAAQDVRAIVAALTGLGRKLVILDLDDTLWGGIVGDEGWKNLRLGGHDAVGEAYVDFQRELLALKRRGIVLAIASKNSEAVVLEAFGSHPEMILRTEDFAARKINWSDKAANIAAIARELNLGLQSAVFIDDSPIERARVREALPEVLVPEWPADPFLYTQALRDLDCFEPGSLTAEDLARSRLYAEEREREQAREDVGSYEDWLRTLDLRVQVEPLGPANRERVVQLFNKTNQLNLSTRRLTDVELDAWLAAGRREMWAFRVADRFGDAGLTGILGLEMEEPQARVIDWVLSCRVMGRKVEETLLAIAVARAKAGGATVLSAEYLPTAKNAPTLEFFERSGWRREGNVFRWDLERPYPAPEMIRLEQ